LLTFLHSMLLDFVEGLGKRAIATVTKLGRWGVFSSHALAGAVSRPFRRGIIGREIIIIGAESLSIIALTGFFTGMVLGLQGYHTLTKFGSEAVLGQGVIITLLSELGPVMSALLLTGRAGSALCAQIGVMRNSEQIDALECMGIETYNYLISPKLVAGLISLPILSLVFCAAGVYGGYLAGCVLLNANPGYYFDGMKSAVSGDPALLRMCLVKSVFFAFVVVTVCAFHGHEVDRQPVKGASGVSKATTEAVVVSSVSILVWDYLLSCILI